MYKCKDKDYAKFEKIDAQIEKKMEQMKKQDALYCADFDALRLNLYGTWKNGDDYQALDIMVLPCG